MIMLPNVGHLHGGKTWKQKDKTVEMEHELPGLPITNSHLVQILPPFVYVHCICFGQRPAPFQGLVPSVTLYLTERVILTRPRF